MRQSDAGDGIRTSAVGPFCRKGPAASVAATRAMAFKRRRNGEQFALQFLPGRQELPGKGAVALLEQPFAAQFVVIVLSEAVSFVAHILEQAQRVGVATEPQGFGFTRPKHLFFAFGE